MKEIKYRARRFCEYAEIMEQSTQAYTKDFIYVKQRWDLRKTNHFLSNDLIKTNCEWWNKDE